MNLDRLKRLLPDGARESDTEYDGFFSYAGEWHSAIVGLAIGLFAPYELIALAIGVALGEQVKSGSKALSEFRSEPWYGLGLMIIGYGGRVLFLKDTIPVYSILEIISGVM